MPAAKPEEKGESSNATSKAVLAASSNGSPNYELPWYVQDSTPPSVLR